VVRPENLGEHPDGGDPDLLAEHVQVGAVGPDDVYRRTEELISVQGQDDVGEGARVCGGDGPVQVRGDDLVADVGAFPLPGDSPVGGRSLVDAATGVVRREVARTFASTASLIWVHPGSGASRSWRAVRANASAAVVIASSPILPAKLARARCSCPRTAPGLKPRMRPICTWLRESNGRHHALE